MCKLLDADVTNRLYRSIFLSSDLLRYRNAVTQYKKTRQGLPQGSVLSYLLFNFMIDDVALQENLIQLLFFKWMI